MITRNILAAGATALLVTACGQKETASPPVDAEPIAAAPPSAPEPPHADASSHPAGDAHDAAPKTAAPARGTPMQQGQASADPKSDMSGMQMPK